MEGESGILVRHPLHTEHWQPHHPLGRLAVGWGCLRRAVGGGTRSCWACCTRHASEAQGPRRP